MFHWYQCSKVCYVYLADVSGDTLDDQVVHLAFTNSRWFIRGWTLQGLIAPGKMVFFSHTWRSLGTKKGLISLLSSITRIGQHYPMYWTSIQYNGGGDPCIAQIMSWAAERKTTRVEDKAYCLLGLFGINMPLLYGEGRKSFFRLQEELLKCSSDQSLLAWWMNPPLQQLDLDKSWTVTATEDTTGMLARGPEDFRNSGNVRLLSDIGDFYHLSQLGSTPAVIHRGFRAEMPVIEIPQLTVTKNVQSSHPQILRQVIVPVTEVPYLAVVLCSFEGIENYVLGIPLMRIIAYGSVRAGYPHYGRCQSLVLIPWDAVHRCKVLRLMIHVDSHWILDWCFNEPVYSTFQTTETFLL